MTSDSSDTDLPAPASRRPQWRGERQAVLVRLPVAVAEQLPAEMGRSNHGNQPRANRNYWAPKLRRHRARDSETDRLLAEAGWTVLRAWEHEPTGEVTARVKQSFGRLRRPSGQGLAR